MYKLQVKLAETWPAGLAEASRQALRKVHATWAEREAREEAARGALAASRACEALALQGQGVGDTMLPGPRGKPSPALS